MSTWKPKKPSEKDPRRGIQRADFLTLDRRDGQPVFICWREGGRLPSSFHRSVHAAQAVATDRVKAGETICVLRAEIVSSVTSARPVITIEDERRELAGAVR